MIIRGRRKTQIASENISNTCSYCGKNNSLQITVFQEYFHFFWIPFFPTKKTSVTKCSHCQNVVQQGKFLKDGSSNYLTSNSKVPIWTFSGLILIAVFVFVGITEGQKREQREIAYITNPKKGDVYEIKVKIHFYTLYKVDAVKSDTVYVLTHKEKVIKRRKLSDLKDTDFTQERLSIPKSDLKNMLEEYVIIGIRRK